MAETTITSANAVLTFMVPGLFPTPITIHGFSSDRAFLADAVDVVETNMGVDGRMTAGYTPHECPFTVSLQADSPSKPFFLALLQAMKTSKEVYYILGSLAIPSTQESFSLIRGVLKSPKQIPDAQKVLQGMDFGLVFERIDRSLL